MSVNASGDSSGTESLVIHHTRIKARLTYCERFSHPIARVIAGQARGGHFAPVRNAQNQETYGACYDKQSKQNENDD